MMPRQRMPMQGGLSPFRMGPPRGMGDNSPFSMNRLPQGQFQRPMMGMPQGQMGMPRGQMGGAQGRRGGPQGQKSKGAGLLAKLLNKGNKGEGLGAVVSQTRAGGAGGSLLKTISNPEAISGFLNNTQQMIKTAQSIGPMVQQYGPIIKNLPVMWKLYKGLKDTNVETETVEEKDLSDKSEEAVQNSSGEETPVQKEHQNNSESSQINSKRQIGNSKPKLYI
jgi:hypothetical protein